MVNVTTHPAIEFFQALGKKEVYIRCLPGKANPDDSADCYSGKAFNVKNGNKFSWPADSWDRLVKVLDINLKNNFCPYVTVANGGKKKDEINSSSALFAEYDAKDISKEDSLKIINDFELQPNIVIETRNGYHFYWLLEEALDVGSWQNINSRLVDKLGSDPCTRDDLARIMRIPGYAHLQKGSDPFMVELLKCDTSFKYTDDDFNRVLPVAKVSRADTDKFKEETDRFRQELLEQGIDFHDMRELAKRLPHYNEFGRTEWATCVCPAHGLDGKKGHHPESLHINRESGRFHCQHICSTREIYHAAYKYLGIKSSFRATGIVLIGQNETQVQTNKEESKESTEDIKKDLLKQILDYLAELEISPYIGYELDFWLDKTESVIEDLTKTLRDNDLNGHQMPGKALLERWKILTGDNTPIELKASLETAKLEFTTKLKDYLGNLEDINWQWVRTTLKEKFIKQGVTRHYNLEEIFQLWERELIEEEDKKQKQINLKEISVQQKNRLAKKDKPLEEQCPTLSNLFKSSSLSKFIEYTQANNYQMLAVITSFLCCANTSRMANTTLKSEHFGKFKSALMACLVGKPSSGKSKTIKLVAEPLQNETLHSKLEKIRREEELKREQEEIKKSKLKGEPYDESEQEILNAKIADPQVYTVSDATEEGLIARVSNQERACAFVNDDLSLAAKHLGKGSNQGSTNLHIFTKGYEGDIEDQNRKVAAETVGLIDFGALVAIQNNLAKNFFDFKNADQGIESRFLFCKIPFTDVELPTGDNLPRTEEEAEALNEQRGELTEHDRIQMLLMNVYTLIRQRSNSNVYRFNEFQNSAFLELQIKRIELRNKLAKDSSPINIGRARMYDQNCFRIAFTLHLVFESLKGFTVTHEGKFMEPTFAGSLEIPGNIKDIYVRAAMELCSLLEDEMEEFYTGVAFNDVTDEEGAEYDLYSLMVDAITRKCNRCNNTGVTHRDFNKLPPFNKITDGTRLQRVREVMKAMVEAGLARFEGGKFYLV